LLFFFEFISERSCSIASTNWDASLRPLKKHDCCLHLQRCNDGQKTDLQRTKIDMRCKWAREGLVDSCVRNFRPFFFFYCRDFAKKRNWKIKYRSTWASSTLIIIFSEMWKFSKHFFFFRKIIIWCNTWELCHLSKWNPQN
jgi:hypothetical protein